MIIHVYEYVCITLVWFGLFKWLRNISEYLYRLKYMLLIEKEQSNKTMHLFKNMEKYRDRCTSSKIYNYVLVPGKTHLYVSRNPEEMTA